MLFSGKKDFVLRGGFIFGVNEYSCFLGAFLEKRSGRIKFEHLLQLKKTSKNMVEVKSENHGL